MCICLGICAYVCRCTYICIYIYVRMYVFMKEIHQNVNSGYFWMVAFSKFSMTRKLLLLTKKTLIDVIFKGQGGTQLLDCC